MRRVGSSRRSCRAVDKGIQRNGYRQNAGRIANSNGLKTEEYGIEAMDKSPYNAKEVPSFRYNQKGVAKLKALAAAHYKQ